MKAPRDLVVQAFERLESLTGFGRREDQVNLALVLCDLIESGATGAIEAPTGIGKSLACLIPAIANSIHGKRTVIATYTNVLAEQYRTKDLPLALSLFEGEGAPPPAFLIGRARYTCLTALREAVNGPAAKIHLEVDAPRYMVAKGETGLESEFRKLASELGVKGRALTQLWSQSSAPAACPARACPDYDACFYYRARDAAQKAGVVITNHSVVIQHGLMQLPSENDEDGPESAGLLGAPDFVILDEAHDFAQAAASGLEFVLSQRGLDSVLAVAQRVESQVSKILRQTSDRDLLRNSLSTLEKALAAASAELGLNQDLKEGSVIAVGNSDWLDHPALRSRKEAAGSIVAERIATSVGDALRTFTKSVRDGAEAAVTAGGAAEGDVKREISALTGCFALLNGAAFGAIGVTMPQPGQISWSTQEAARDGTLQPALRTDTVDLRSPLREILWGRIPAACVSATLAVDGNFDFLRRTVGFEPQYEEVLPSPFDYARQAVICIPKEGRIPDPSTARGPGREQYWDALAREVTAVIRRMSGRTLALFHSRREMEEVYARLTLPESLPVLIQPRYSPAGVADRFRANPAASLLGVRSFWTGFDAPGATLSCIILARIPFEVPVLPPQIARMVMLAQDGLDPFTSHTLAQAKMLMRQGTGRLIRTESDCGLICLLDPRIRTKPYGESILENLPPGMTVFDDLADVIVPGLDLDLNLDLD